MTDAARWYIAILIFRAPTVAGDRFVIDHRFVLVRAVDGQAAYERALFLGHSRAKGESEFAGLHDLRALGGIDVDDQGKVHGSFTIEEIVDGTEVYAFPLPEDQAWCVMPKAQLTEFWDPTTDPFIRAVFGDGR